jgi:hypothetical protein
VERAARGTLDQRRQARPAVANPCFLPRQIAIELDEDLVQVTSVVVSECVPDLVQTQTEFGQATRSECGDGRLH